MGWSRVVSTTLDEFLRHTTIGGLCNAGLASSRVRKAFWMIVFAILFAFTLQSFIGVIVQYLKYEVTTSTDLSYSSTLNFPAITICSQNRIHCINLFEQSFALKNLIDVQNSSSFPNTSALNETASRFNKLTDIFMNSGCLDQVCLSLIEMTSPIRNSSDPTNDYIIMKIVAIKCQLPPIKPKVCYYLAMMNLTANTSTSPSIVDVKSAWSSYQCSSDDACSYFIKDPTFTKPTDCKSKPNFGPLGSNRKKRQAGNVGPGGGQRTNLITPPVNADFQTSSVFLAKFMELSEKDRIAIGHKLDDYNSTTFGHVYGFLYSCTYKGRNCLESKYWYTYSTPKYGNCYTFNTLANIGNDENIPRQASLTGRDYGIAIELFLDQDNYMLQKLSKNAGAKIVVHDSDLPPLPDEYGIDMQPNTASSIAIQTTNITRQPAPYTSMCINGWSETGYDISPSINYSLASCQRYSLQKDIAEDCKCFHPFLVHSGIESEFGRRPCLITPSTNSSSDFFCFNEIIDSYNNMTRNSSCSVSCSEIQFSSAVSTSTWPSDQYWVFLALEMDKYKHDMETALGPEKDKIKSEIQDNYAKAEVFFQTLNVINIKQSPTIEKSSLISALGGALGLFTGIAIIMLFELLELFFDLLYNLWLHNNKLKNENPKKTTKIATIH